ncbi:WhiB family transcriptional regulator [Rhodococcus sp. NPDC059968]|uniref:WhiB family transcriptional regulator n=1 Tax=Rhodococcus sp. NPDC059968 TaxID=3347017 RepID=UPI00366B66AA
MSEPTLEDLFPRRGEVTLDSGDWWARAACLDAELAVFFSPDDERGHARDRRETRARQICRPCPVLAQCGNHALVMGETYGVWGGMTEGDRRKRSRRPRRGECRPLESLHTRTVADVPRIRRSALSLP